jgi:hypothetical protein
VERFSLKSVKKKAAAPVTNKSKTKLKTSGKDVAEKSPPKSQSKPASKADASKKLASRPAKASKANATVNDVKKTKLSSVKPKPTKAVKAPKAKPAAPAEKTTKSSKTAPKVAIRATEDVKPKVAKAKAATAPKAQSLPKERVKPTQSPTEIVPVSTTNPEVVEKLRKLQERREQSKDLARPQDARASLVHSDPVGHLPAEPAKDRVVLLVRDPYWLQASWDISRRAVQRAKAALAGQWHTVKPILRIMELDDSGTTNNAESIVRDIEIHSGVRNWYVAIANPPVTLVAALGYMCSNGRFHELCRSNKVRTPVPGSNDAVDDHWADIAKDAERVFGLSGGFDEESHPDELRSMFEDRLNRPMSGPTTAEYGTGADGSLRRARDFHFELDVEMVVFGSTQPNAKLIVGSEPVSVRTDGTFSARIPMPNTRQVIPVTSRARDGSDEQTIVIAVERNTKVMEPVSNNDPEE